MNGNRPVVVAADQHGVIAEFDGWRGDEHFGEPIAGAREALAELRRRGIKIMVYTCRQNLVKVKEYLEKNQIPYDFINENPYSPPDIHPSKIYADIYVDDRAVSFTNWPETLEQLKIRTGLEKRAENCQKDVCMCRCKGVV